MEDDEIKGKVTVIIQSSTLTTSRLEQATRAMFSMEADHYLCDEDELDVFVVPSDEEF